MTHPKNLEKFQIFAAEICLNLFPQLLFKEDVGFEKCIVIFHNICG